MTLSVWMAPTLAEGPSLIRWASKYFRELCAGFISLVVLFSWILIGRTTALTLLLTPPVTFSLRGDPPIPGMVPTDLHQSISSRYKDVHRCPKVEYVDRPNGCRSREAKKGRG